MIFTDDSDKFGCTVYRSRPRPISISIYSAGFAVPCVLEALPTMVSAVGIELVVQFELEPGQLLVCSPSSTATGLPALYRILRCSPGKKRQFSVWAEMLAILPTEDLIRRYSAGTSPAATNKSVKN